MTTQLLLPVFFSSALAAAFSPPSDPLLVCSRVAQRVYDTTLPSTLPAPFRLVDTNAPGCTAISLSPAHTYRVALMPTSTKHQTPLLPSWLTKGRSRNHNRRPKAVTCLADCSSDDHRRAAPPFYLLVAPADISPQLVMHAAPPTSILALMSMDVPSIPLGLLLERGAIADAVKIECMMPHCENGGLLPALFASLAHYHANLYSVAVDSSRGGGNGEGGGGDGWIPYPPMYVCLSTGRRISEDMWDSVVLAE